MGTGGSGGSAGNYGNGGNGGVGGAGGSGALSTGATGVGVYLNGGTFENAGTVTGSVAVQFGAYAGTAFADRFRAFASRIFLRIRRDLGVASTYSSGPMYSSTRSRLIFSGGAS